MHTCIYFQFIYLFSNVSQYVFSILYMNTYLYMCIYIYIYAMIHLWLWDMPARPCRQATAIPWGQHLKLFRKIVQTWATDKTTMVMFDL